MFRSCLRITPTVKIRIGATNLAYTILFFFLAGGVVGSAFKVRTLLLLLCIVLVEFSYLAMMKLDSVIPWAIVSLALIQVGYFVGMSTRGLFEQVRHMYSNIKPRQLL